jgi:hypothetical protein
MSVMRDTAKRSQGYSLDDAADFLEYDRKAVEYWLRMGHLKGDWDAVSSRWTISPQSLIDFLKQSREPMPTGAGHRMRRQPTVTGAVPAELLAD